MALTKSLATSNNTTLVVGVRRMTLSLLMLKTAASTTTPGSGLRPMVRMVAARCTVRLESCCGKFREALANC
jgi:hypothetical protein